MKQIEEENENENEREYKIQNSNSYNDWHMQDMIKIHVVWLLRSSIFMYSPIGEMDRLNTVQVAQWNFFFESDVYSTFCLYKPSSLNSRLKRDP